MVINSMKFLSGGHRRGVPRPFLAIAASPPSAAKPTAFQKFVRAHPSAPAAFKTVATPDSFADEEYYGIDASSSSPDQATAGCAL